MKAFIIAIDSLKKVKSADSKGIKAEDVNGAEEETTKVIHEMFNLIIKQDSIDSQFMDKCDHHGDLQKMRPDETIKLSPNLYPRNAVQFVLHDALQQTIRSSSTATNSLIRLG